MPIIVQTRAPPALLTTPPRPRARSPPRDACAQEINERDAWELKPGGKYFFTRNMSAVCAFAVGGSYVPGSGFVVVGAHTDSPCPKLKPNTKATSERFLQVRTQNYGGGLWYTWFDRDLGVAGRVVVKRAGVDKARHAVVKIDRPVMRIPSLAIHLNRDMNNGFAVNFQQHMAPIIANAAEAALGSGSVPPEPKRAKADGSDENKNAEKNAARHHPALLELIAEAAGCDPADVADFDLQLCDVQPSTIGGAKNEYIFSGRLDNLASCYASLAALINATGDSSGGDSPGSLAHETGVRMLVHYDHEEVGSDSAQGAGSSMTEDAMRRVCSSLCRGRDEIEGVAERSRRKSFIVSADMAHAVHPNYGDKHEPGHRPRFGDGVVIKHNANQRYATDAVTAWLFRELGERAGVPVQEFVVRSDLGCGSTIGPILSTRTGIRTVDVGAPQLSMHSVREMCGCDDVKHSVAHFTAVYEGFTKLDETLMVDGAVGNLCRPCD